MKRLTASVVFIGSIFYLVRGELPTASFYHLQRDKDLLSSAFITCEQDDYGFIWFGSFYGGGLYRFDGYEIKTFVIDPSRIQNALTSNNINSVYAPGDGYLYVGTHGGWNQLDLVSGEFIPFAHTHDVCPEEGAFFNTRIVKDRQSRLWITSHYGLSAMDLSDGVIRWLKPSNGIINPVPDQLRDLILDRKHPNQIWLASYHGLFRYEMYANSYELIPNGPRDVRTLAQDSAGKIWVVVSNSSTLFGFDPATESWTPYEVGQSLHQMGPILGIDILENDQIWLSSENHVGIFYPGIEQYAALTEDSTKGLGLLPQGNFYDVLNDRNGRLWIGSWYGVQYSSDSMALSRSCSKPISVHIVDIQSSNERRDVKKPIIYNKPILLLKDQRDFQIKYVLPNPLDISSVEFEYKLDGYDRDWISTTSREARYSKVAGGNYTFYIRGREGNLPFTATTSLSVAIEKKLSEYWWFWVISIGTLVEVIAGGVWLRMSTIRKQERMQAKFQQDLAEVQMQALRSQMNPHFLFNCLNSIKYYALSKDKHATADYLSKFSLLVRTILNNSKSETIDLKDELEAIRLYVEIENLRLENKFDYQIDVDPAVLNSQVQIPPMVLQPYVENAIWHGLMHREGRGHLSIQVKNLGERIQCIIEDDGVGREKSRRLNDNQTPLRKSMGMQITSDRLKLVREMYGVDIFWDVIDLVDAEGNGIGTRVLVEIPHIYST